MSGQRHLIDNVRKTAWATRNGLFVPRVEGDVQTNFPRCLTCLREVEATELKNFNRHSVELWARCHGKEDFYKVEFPFDIGGWDMESEQVQDNIRAAMRTTFFNPRNT